MLLLPFIENAFKHSLAHEKDKAWIHIDIRLKKDDLHMQVANSCHPSKQTNGIGLANVKKRLELSYPGQYQLNIHPGDERFEIDLTIALKTPV
jgi:LytS/YehU family sensor histidine kinase